MTQQRVAVVAGASGLVGGLLSQHLAVSSDWSEVRLLVRRPIPALTGPKVRQIIVDWDHLPQWQEELAVDALFCALGTTRAKAGSAEAFRRVDYGYPLALGRLAKAAGARHFGLVSSVGADPGSRVRYARTKGEIENALRALGLNSLAILRPSLLLGDRAEFRLGERLAIALMRPLGPLFVGRLARYRGIEAATVARALERLAIAAAPGVQILESEAIVQVG
jgi:uncharacterized protein YbjT (DUF2867 family)